MIKNAKFLHKCFELCEALHVFLGLAALPQAVLGVLPHKVGSNHLEVFREVRVSRKNEIPG